MSAAETGASAPVGVDTLTGPEIQSWQDSAAVLTQLGLPSDVVERILTKAFGWGQRSAFWRGEKVNEVPTAKQVESALEYLRSLGISGAELTKLVQAFPEVVACDVDKQLKASVEVLEKSWRLSGDVLTKAILRRPQILGFNVDCAGDCIGECNRCWVRF